METKVEVLRASAAQAAGTVTGIAGAGLITFAENVSEVVVQLLVSAAASEVSDTLDVYVDVSYDGGTEFLNIGHFTQVLGNGGAKKFAMGFAANPLATANCVPIGTEQAAGNALQFPLGSVLRYRSVVVDAGGVAAGFTHAITAFVKFAQ